MKQLRDSTLIRREIVDSQSEGAFSAKKYRFLAISMTSADCDAAFWTVALYKEAAETITDRIKNAKVTTLDGLSCSMLIGHDET